MSPEKFSGILFGQKSDTDIIDADSRCDWPLIGRRDVDRKRPIQVDTFNLSNVNVT